MVIASVPKRYLPAILIFVFVLIALVPSYYFYAKYRDAQFRLQNPTAATQEDTKNIIQKVSAFMLLPINEDPTLATINDSTKLKDQAFFANSENGDKILIYTKAKKAILYRPSTNKIVEVAPITIGQNGTATASSQAISTTKFSLYNGTNQVGLTKKYESELKSKVANSEVVSREDAKDKAYTKTEIIDVKGGRVADVEELAKRLGINVGFMPKGEATPTADFLIIIGADKK